MVHAIMMVPAATTRMLLAGLLMSAPARTMADLRLRDQPNKLLALPLAKDAITPEMT